MVGSLAPKLDVVVISAKTIIPYRKCEYYLSISICNLIVPSVRCAIEGIHFNPGFGQTVPILYSNSNGNRHGNADGITPGQCAVVGGPTPKLRAIQVSMETVTALR